MPGDTQQPGSSPSAASAPAWSPRGRAAALAGLFTLFTFFATYYLSELPLLDPDEPRYAQAGRQMAEGGSWLIPEFNGDLRINKPPLFYWLVAGSNLALGGSNEVSSRLPSILMGFAMLALTVWLGVRLYDETTGYLAGLILCTSPLFFAINRGCVIDQTFSTLLAAALACLLLGLTGCWPWKPRASAAPGLPFDSSLLAAAAFAGLAFMAKGTAMLIVLFVPALFILCFYRAAYFRSPGFLWSKLWLGVAACGLAWAGFKWATDEPGTAFALPAWCMAGGVMAVLAMLYYGLREYWRQGRWIVAVAILVILSAWWYLLLMNEVGIQRFVDLVRYEIVGRLTGKMHAEKWHYYLANFPAVYFPWSVALVAAVGCACRNVTAPLPLRPADEPTAEHCTAVRGISDAWLAAWVLGVVIFFSIPKAKLATYVLPAFPAAALLTARYLRRLGGASDALPKAWRSVCIATALLATAAFVFYFSGLVKLKKDLQGTLDDLPVSQWIVVALLAVVIAVPWTLTSVLRRPAYAYVPLSAFVVALLAAAVPIAIEPLNKRSNKRLALQVLPLSKEVDRCISLGCEEESLVYYLNRTVREARRPDPSKGEDQSHVVREVLGSTPPGKLLIFVHSRYFQLWMKGQVPEGATEVTRNQHIVVLLNKPPEPGSSPAAAKPAEPPAPVGADARD